MVTTDTIEGLINDVISYHYNVSADVLYLRLLADMNTLPSARKRMTVCSSCAMGKPVG